MYRKSRIRTQSQTFKSRSVRNRNTWLTVAVFFFLPRMNTVPVLQHAFKFAPFFVVKLGKTSECKTVAEAVSREESIQAAHQHGDTHQLNDKGTL
jgi:hypothetical protein